MLTVVALHIFAGSLALVFGFVALFAKGASVHRKSGLLFVGAMVATPGRWV